VRLDVELDAGGQVLRALALTDPEWAAAAEDLTRACRFEPASLNGEPIAVTFQFTWWFPDVEPPALPEGEPAELVARYALPPSAQQVLLDAEAIRLAPGSLGDPLRALQGSPGMTRTPMDAGWPLVHGGDFDHTALFVDGVRTPLLLHLGGFTSVLHPSLVQQVALHPGLAPARFRDALTGAVAVETRPVGTNLAGELGVNTAFAELFAETPLPKGGLAVGARRSWLDGVLALTLGPSASRIAPRFWDLSARFDHGGSRWTLLTFRDALEAPSSTTPGAVVDVSQSATQLQGQVQLGGWKALPWLTHHQRALDGQDQQVIQENAAGARLERAWAGPVHGQVGFEGGPTWLHRTDDLQERRALSWRSDVDLRLEAGAGPVRPRVEGRLNGWSPPEGPARLALGPQGGLAYAAGRWQADASFGRCL
jgi:hypothetical protein